MVHLNNDWDNLLKEEFTKPYYIKLREFLIGEYRRTRVYPDMHDIFNALKYTPYHKVKVVILGQDPYHGPGQAHGLCFSVKKGVAKPPSLVNIFKELKNDLGIPEPTHGCLIDWTKEGVLLLNTVLTVREGEANSHSNKGWEQFTDKVITLLAEREKPMVFILWGANAAKKAELIKGNGHFILQTVHPSPLSAHRGFFGCKHFSKTNQILKNIEDSPINWQII